MKAQDAVDNITGKTFRNRMDGFRYYSNFLYDDYEFPCFKVKSRSHSYNCFYNGSCILMSSESDYGYTKELENWKDERNEMGLRASKDMKRTMNGLCTGARAVVEVDKEDIEEYIKELRKEAREAHRLFSDYIVNHHGLGDDSRACYKLKYTYGNLQYQFEDVIGINVMLLKWCSEFVGNTKLYIHGVYSPIGMRSEDNNRVAMICPIRAKAIKINIRNEK